MRLLLISNSTNAGEEYLRYPLDNIRQFLGGVREVLFVPYAAVTFSYDDYVRKVQARMDEIGIKVRGVHEFADPLAQVAKAEAIMVGGGNTFALTAMMQKMGLVQAIAERVHTGVPYVGWSAGSNMACPTIRTTNDMPIVQPASFDVLGLVPFQINPHYLDHNPAGHAGETREQRIEEFIAANPGVWVAGLREGCMLRFEQGRLSLIGPRPMRIFRAGQQPKEVAEGEDLSFLL